jgi:hypothetical protein
VYVTLLERSESRRRPEAVAAPRLVFERNGGAPTRVDARALDGARGHVLAATTIHVGAGPAASPVPVALIEVEGERHLARLDRSALADAPPEDELAGLRVRLAVGADGDVSFRPEPGLPLVRWAVTKGTSLFRQKPS